MNSVSFPRENLYDFVRLLTEPLDSYYDPVVGGTTTLLHYAVSHNQLKTARFLLKTIDANYINDRGQAPLHYAYSKEMIELLLSRGADPHQKDFIRLTPMMVHRYRKKCLWVYHRNGYRIPDYIRGDMVFNKRPRRVKRSICILLALKRRRITSMGHLDRFLMRELAIEIYSTR
jgi:hypothetical protein